MTPVTGNSVSLDTARVILVPEDEWAGEGRGEKGAGATEGVRAAERTGVAGGVGEAYLRFCGMDPAEDEVVVSRPVDGIIAVMAVPTTEWAQYKDGYERGEVDMTSPLLAVATGGGGRGRKREVNIVMTPENVYIAVWEKGLRMAEALPDNSTDSILYYMQVTGRRFRLPKFDINVSGPRAGIVADALRKYYKKVRVGTPPADF